MHMSNIISSHLIYISCRNTAHIRLSLLNLNRLSIMMIVLRSPRYISKFSLFILISKLVFRRFPVVLDFNFRLYFSASSNGFIKTPFMVIFIIITILFITVNVMIEAIITCTTYKSMIIIEYTLVQK